jgi:acyl-coenzyme A thioesterase PaaI-like protein
VLPSQLKVHLAIWITFPCGGHEAGWTAFSLHEIVRRMHRHPVMSLDAACAWLTEVVVDPGRLRVDAVEDDRVVCTAGPTGLELRRDGTISGPAIFWAVDLTGFVAVNVLLGPTPAMALANGVINFLDAAEPGALRVTAEVIKLASRSGVVDVRARDHRDLLVATSTLHFALPSRAGRVAVTNGHVEPTVR